MTLNSYPQWKNILCGVLFLAIHCSVPAKAAAELQPATTVVKQSKAIPPQILEVSSSDKQEVKIEHKIVSSSDEKLSTSATLGYVNAGIIYDAPLSGAYGGFGPHPGSFVAPAYQGIMLNQSN